MLSQNLTSLFMIGPESFKPRKDALAGTQKNKDGQVKDPHVKRILDEMTMKGVIPPVTKAQMFIVGILDPELLQHQQAAMQSWPLPELSWSFEAGDIASVRGREAQHLTDWWAGQSRQVLVAAFHDLAMKRADQMTKEDDGQEDEYENGKGGDDEEEPGEKGEEGYEEDADAVARALFAAHVREELGPEDNESSTAGRKRPLEDEEAAWSSKQLRLKKN